MKIQRNNSRLAKMCHHEIRWCAENMERARHKFDYQQADYWNGKKEVYQDILFFINQRRERNNNEMGKPED